jgi:hypothetical protein
LSLWRAKLNFVRVHSHVQLPRQPP